MKRSGPPARRTPLKRGKALRPVSQTRLDEHDERDAVRLEVLERDRGCVAKALVPEVKCCGGEDVDEVVLRTGRPGGHLDPTNAQTLCRCHHIWKDNHPELAVERGLRRWSWDDDRTQGGTE